MTSHHPLAAARPVSAHLVAGSRRMLLLLLTLALAASTIVVQSPQARAAGANSMSFRDGSVRKTFGPNGTVMIDGALRYDDGCIYDQGVKDFFYAASDIYLVPTGTVAFNLVDAGGDGPNTIVGTGSGAFLDEVIAFTAPGGNLGDGVYDIVFDTCQDGFFGEGDSIFSQAVTVRLPETLPPVSPSITNVKEQARKQYASWLETHLILTAILNAEKAAEILACLLAAGPVCLARTLAIVFDEGTIGARQAATIQSLAASLVLNVAKNHGAIWKDPPDADHERLPVLVRPLDGDLPVAGEPLADAFAALLPTLADEAAVTEAFLHAVERYQGAQAAGHRTSALVQARAARDLSGVLADQLASSSAVRSFRDLVAANASDINASFTAGSEFHNRVRRQGLAPDERRILRNQGLTTSQLVDLEAEFVQARYIPGYSAGDLVSRLDAVLAGRDEMRSAMEESVTGWASVVASLTSASAPVEADAGGPYTTTGTTPLRLDASASSPDASSFAWDLDLDGAFDDATGAQPELTFPEPGTHLVSVRVRDAGGREAVDHAVVNVTVGNRAPQITSSSPEAAVAMVAGDTTTFTIAVTDPDGEPTSTLWELNGDEVATGTSFTWTPGTPAIGPHALQAIVTDAGGARAIRSWRVAVHGADLDRDGWSRGPDCDDTRADVNPGLSEQLGNALDDDCDASTPDAPPGGVTAQVWSWGYSEGNGKGRFVDETVPGPIPTTLLPEVVQLASTRASALAVLPDGEVRSWGQNHHGMLGDGTTTPRRTPVPVVGVGGSGVLTGVTQVAMGSMTSVARRQDGTVVAWGFNYNGQVGDGSTVQSRPAPVVVITEDGTPLTGVTAVEAGEAENIALMADGTLMSWGVQRCRGQSSVDTVNVAMPVPLFGGNIVQVVAGDNMVMARKADGSVWACAGRNELMDRGGPLTGKQTATPGPMLTFPPGSGVVDVSSGGEAAVALTQDGSLWLWGRNLNGVLNPLAVPAGAVVSTPTKVALPPGPRVIDVEMDTSCHGLAMREDGSVLSWGCNASGAAGIGQHGGFAPGIHVLDIGGGAAIQVDAPSWNGYALVRPAQETWPQRPVPWVRLTANDATIDEGTGGHVELDLDAPAPVAVDVTWLLEGADAPVVSTIPAGATQLQVPVSVADDVLDEDAEELAFSVLQVSNGVQVVRRTATVTVVDDDDEPSIDILPISVPEGNTSLTDVVVKMVLSAPSGRDVEVLWSTQDGSATSPADFSEAAGHVLIPAGATQSVVHLAVHGDIEVEPHEMFTVRLADPVRASLGTAEAVVTIVDDEPLVLHVASPTVTEGDGGTTPATFEVSVTPPAPGTTVHVDWAVAGATAQVPQDVDAASGTLAFGATVSTRHVTVQAVGDTAEEVDESFRLLLSSATASDGRLVILGDPSVAWILDDDAGEEPPPTGFDFDGFRRPVENLPTVNVVQPGQAIPIKFSLGGDHGLEIFEAGHPASKVTACSDGADQTPMEPTGTAGGSSLSYDADADQYTYVWKTLKSWKGQCRRLVVRFVDGTQAEAAFRFK